MDSVWMFGVSEVEIRTAEGGALIAKDRPTLRHGDEENRLDLVSEWRECKQNRAFEQEKWTNQALHRK